MTLESASQGLLEQYKDELDDDLIHALSAAYALIVCSDQELSPAEVSRFFSTLNGEGPLREIMTPDLDHAMRDMTDLMLNDYEKGLEYAKQEFEKIRSSTKKTDLVLKMAQVAIVADDVLKEEEELIMKTICEVLQVDPKKY